MSMECIVHYPTSSTYVRVLSYLCALCESYRTVHWISSIKNQYKQTISWTQVVIWMVYKMVA